MSAQAAATLIQSGMQLQASGRLADAEALMRRALGILPTHPDPYISLSSVLNAQQKSQEAVEVCEDGLKRFPEHKVLLHNLAVCLDSAGRYDEAIALLERRVRSHPGYAQGHYHLGILYRKQGRIEEALGALRKAAKHEPRDLQALTASADCLLRLGRPEEALAPLDAALRLKPWHVRAIALKTVALAGAGRADEERWLADPQRLLQSFHISELGMSDAEIGDMHARLSAFSSSHPSMRLDPAGNAAYNGWHSENVGGDDEPALGQLKKFISHVLKRRKESLGQEDAHHPFRRSIPPAFGLNLWTVKLEGGGKMTPHIHTDGWLSGVYYVDVPKVVNDPAAAQAGWIKFGVPLPEHTLPRLPTIAAVKPAPGLMVTFPSYFWHATVPLPAATEHRLIYSFDLQPRPTYVPGPLSIA